MISKLNIAILPSSTIFLGDVLFEKNRHRDDCLYFFRLLKEKGRESKFRIHTYDKYLPNEIDILVFYRLDLNVRRLLRLLKANKKLKLVHIIHEPPTVVPFHILEILEDFPFDMQYILNDDVAEKSKWIKKIVYGITPISMGNISTVKYDKKKFITTISSAKFSNSKNELYSERMKVVRYFSQKREGFDLYGVNWDRYKDKIIKSVYRGMVDNKKEILKQYKFTICFENTKDCRGYITEKIFDCFAAGTVPIYYGAPNITTYIPKVCFIDYRDFKNCDDLYVFLREMSESTYQKYLRAAKQFVDTDEYRRITAHGYVDTLLNGLKKIEKIKVSRNALGLRVSLLKNVAKNGMFYIKNFKKMKRYIIELIMPTL